MIKSKGIYSTQRYYYFQKEQKDEGNKTAFGIFTLQQIYVLDTQNDELNNKKISGFQDI